MSRSTVTAKFQTTVPKEVRQRLGTKPGDVLQWQVVGDHVRVTTVAPVFLELQGAFKVGPGDTVEDIRAARESIDRR
jgi:AbrB family looped-hinge helix DNA binding protein